MLHNTFRFPPLSNITPYQFAGFVGWGLAVIVGMVVLAVAVRRIPRAKRAADKGSPLASFGLLGAVGVVLWFAQHSLAIPSSQWWDRPIAGLGDLYYSALVSLLVLQEVMAPLVLGPVFVLAIYAVSRWLDRKSVV